MFDFLAAKAAVWGAVIRDHLEERAASPLKGGDRGDVSVTTVIIWVAAITGAVAIAALITALMNRYGARLNGI
ncbi:hypothetical protein [Streptomyces alkaliterrae]|uniref:DUF2970 domain-containing protein n=1 Tax=Streptomyces alkaliterrae TaxID=2213162 RepID=A0A5P0YMP1_9ACTN|nr:hypothetical protein [Streptomyces alkaliterrae]MBB1258336.1 hypothetical protein [Streptomyces alkaliterrae]MQS00682.1 hypothetical protein [Streptomyces alkaliterrae]